ncbi:1483_t:CDS:2 [Ambispora leptoticha]|uniref:Mitochondrial import inner membrane translocase subunit n=1 Tax=Ambispora leptoticha TaxID=144679 RepID=A0A9N9EK06_9GLOM|nr:1483_t:CDS:2 [Ambispora leptoticha]
MSYLYGGINQQQTINPQNVAMAEQELEIVTDTFQRIVDSCFKKCIPTQYLEGELNKGESVCIDRCATKFFK